MEHVQQAKRPHWMSLALWQMLEAIEPNTNIGNTDVGRKEAKTCTVSSAEVVS
jgi:hypothetical protein